jgi:hypothetical protein
LCVVITQTGNLVPCEIKSQDKRPGPLSRSTCPFLPNLGGGMSLRPYEDLLRREDVVIVSENYSGARQKLLGDRRNPAFLIKGRELLPKARAIGIRHRDRRHWNSKILVYGDGPDLQIFLIDLGRTGQEPSIGNRASESAALSQSAVY